MTAAVDATRAALAELGVATCHEALGRVGLCAPELRPIYPGARVAGPAVTVLCAPGDNLPIHRAVDVCGPGDVLVVATTSLCRDGMFGELLGVALRARGGVALVTDAGVRDVADLTAMRLPVWSRFVSAQGTAKSDPGAVNVPVVAGGALVHPGDVILADDDGVLVVPRAQAARVAAAGRERAEKEAAARRRLTAGESGLDVHGLRHLLAPAPDSGKGSRP
ncbi:4-carboxy-4-hydroxy-2-oxoadipate aldolase/oxaloacetate decarboxylase [Phytohabitans kaempferiae]|uniref:Putative 4-hydroxy-4-methyl-2-oxoglutarate aldolase n=1 Tax=Phytohabitans kaempferiae TaxID=1620943 RepID=A0ABV6LZA2_9ACTN